MCLYIFYFHKRSANTCSHTPIRALLALQRKQQKPENLLLQLAVLGPSWSSPRPSKDTYTSTHGTRRAPNGRELRRLGVP